MSYGHPPAEPGNHEQFPGADLRWQPSEPVVELAHVGIH